MNKTLKTLLLILAALVVLAGLLFLIPRVRSAISWRVDAVATTVRGWFLHPQNVGFSPASTESINLAATLTAIAQLPTATPAPTQENNTPTPQVTPTATLPPLPASASVSGVRYYSQHGYFNYCAPANLAMTLSFWGWKGKITDIGDVVKPYPNDKNVMPYELVDYAVNNAGLNALVRVGGDLDTIKRFLAAGYPVLVEKGVYLVDLQGHNSWMGHYQVVTAYDDAKGSFVTQDSYIQANYVEPYDQFIKDWRAFDYTYIIVYSADKSTEVNTLLGADADEAANNHNAFVQASNEAVSLSGVDQFFAWYNVGTNLVALQDYNGAAKAFDQAFALYNQLPQDMSVRPYRILWYETGPFKAYYYTGRYQDVIDMATKNSIGVVLDDQPALEESFYWRGMAEQALGDTQDAITDFQNALKYHTGFPPAVAALQALGLGPTPSP
jgi:hypothetical protein